MNEYAVAVIRGSPFFQGLSRDETRRLAELSRTAELKRREVLFRENEPGEALYLLERGCVQLFKSGRDGTETVIRTVQPDEIFAEVILFEAHRYPVTARAVVDSRVMAFARSGFLRLLDEARFRDDFVAGLMEKLRYLSGRVRALSSYDVEERFWRFLLEQYGTSVRIEPEMSKKDMAAAIGATPETFSRLIRRLKARRALSWDGGTIVLAPGFWADNAWLLDDD